MSNESKRCKVHYTGTFNDGTKFDSSYDRGEPLEFVCGAGMMIKGFDEAVKNMNLDSQRSMGDLPSLPVGDSSDTVQPSVHFLHGALHGETMSQAPVRR